MDTQSARTVIRELIESCIRSERVLFSISEQVANGGLKVLLGTYAQERAEFAQELQRLDYQYGDTPPQDDNPINALDRGWKDIKIAMTVGNENQEEEALKSAAESEKETLSDYEKALESALPDWLRSKVSAHQQQIMHEYKRISQMAGNEEQRLVVQLFNSTGAAQHAIQELEQAGFSRDRISQEQIKPQVKPFQERKTERARSANNATLTGALIGAVIGLALGIGYGFMRINFDPQVAMADVGWGSIVTSGLVGLAVAASFGSFFGFFVGRNAVEEDQYIYKESLEEGSTLVFVSAPAADVDNAADLMRVQHQQELTGARA